MRTENTALREVPMPPMVTTTAHRTYEFELPIGGKPVEHVQAGGAAQGQRGGG